MSSTYRVLCLSHQPALCLDEPTYSRPEAAETALRNGIEGHAHCDLVIGRYSAALVEIGCPSSRDQGIRQTGCRHSSTEWTDWEWLWLLAAAYQSTDEDVRDAVRRGRHHCYPWKRLARLSAEFGFAVKEQP